VGETNALGVDGADELKALGLHRGQVALAGAVVADRDDGVGEALRVLAEAGSTFIGPEHRQPADRRAGEPGVGVDEPDRLKPPRGA
jgi:hypothetical protein